MSVSVLEDQLSVASAQDEVFFLSDVEVETLRRAATDRMMSFDPIRRCYTKSELGQYGMVREGYTREELRTLGYGPDEVTSFDPAAASAETKLAVDVPFGSGIRKWQLPVDILPMRVLKTIFAPGTRVTSHVHPPHTADAPGGGLRVVIQGAILYKGKKYGPGDWFFVPNGTPYEFVSDPHQETVALYKYAFFGFEQGNRFSHPHAHTEGRSS